MQQGCDCPLFIIRGHRSEFLNYDAFLSLKVVLTSTKCEDTDFLWDTPPLSPTPHFSLYFYFSVCCNSMFVVVFHMHLHSLPKYPFRGYQDTKGYKR